MDLLDHRLTTGRGSNMIRRALFAVLIALLLPSISIGAISFSGGKWSTTFSCAEQSQFVGSLACDGLDWWNNYTDVPGHTTQIIADANNPSGGGGRGARFWVTTGQNLNTGTINATFPSYQKEMWIRWYSRHQLGWSFSNLEDDKNLYIWSAGNVTQVIPEFYQNSYRLTAQATPDPNPVITAGWGWNQVMGGSTGDGQWHCFEIYLKMDTNGSNGVGRFWVDGILRASNTAVNWSNNNTTAQQGWDHFYFEENQKYISNGPWYVDYDDVVVYNTTPPNTDSYGNPMIGLLGTTPTNPACYKDTDGDFYGDGTLVFADPCPAGYYLASHFISPTGDCNDVGPLINPGAADLCPADGIDQDCSGVDTTCTGGTSKRFKAGGMNLKINGKWVKTQ